MFIYILFSKFGERALLLLRNKTILRLCWQLSVPALFPAQRFHLLRSFDTEEQIWPTCRGGKKRATDYFFIFSLSWNLGRMLPDLHRKLSYCLVSHSLPWRPMTTASQEKSLHTSLLPGPILPISTFPEAKQLRTCRLLFLCSAAPISSPVQPFVSGKRCWLLQGSGLKVLTLTQRCTGRLSTTEVISKVSCDAYRYSPFC